MGNLSKGLQFRELVGAILRADGHVGVSHKPQPRKLGEQLADDVMSDIRGLDGWAVVTRNVGTRDLSQGIADAKAAAKHDGARYSAAIYRRHDGGAQSSYVVTELADFSDLLTEVRQLREAAR